MHNEFRQWICTLGKHTTFVVADLPDHITTLARLPFAKAGDPLAFRLPGLVDVPRRAARLAGVAEPPPVDTKVPAVTAGYEWSDDATDLPKRWPLLAEWVPLWRTGQLPPKLG